MRMYYYWNNQKVTKKFVVSQIGETKVKQYTEIAKRRFAIDPYELQSWYIDGNILNIEYR